ncbi:MAG: DUF4783 domain-containing protein [Chitinophagales bacterium]|nr:DUF4783 domain-containing protein [Chitinophagales bacterium]
MKTYLSSTLIMKTIFMAAAMLFLFAAHAQNSEALLAGLKAGNASAVAKHFESSIEFTLPSKSSAYSKAQAEVVLREFFSKKDIKGFELKHQGTSPEGSKYFVGTLQTAAGNYSTYIYGKVVNGVLTVRELRIEE